MSSDLVSVRPAGQPQTHRRPIRPPTEDAGWRREQDLSAVVKEFWAERGARVSVRVEPICEHHGATIWGVRSDLLGGLPR
jgi:hypothetical protein